MVNVLKALILTIISPILGFFLTYILATSNLEFASSQMPFFFWVFSSISLIIVLNLLFNRGGKKETGVPWGAPEEIRDHVVNTPQFVGRFDKGKGMLESTARMVSLDVTPIGQKVISLRGELLDQHDSPLEYIPVEIKGDGMKWVGNIVDGDRIRVQGKLDDGVLQAKNAFNFSTNSWVGERRKTK